MSITTPSSPLQELQKILKDVKSALPKSNPYLDSSLIKSNPIGLARRVYDLYYVLRQAVAQAFPFSSVDEFLDFWGKIKNMKPLTSKVASGPATFTGTLGESVPAGSVFKVGTLEYTVDNLTEVVEIEIPVISLTAQGTTAVCVTDEETNLVSGMNISIEGASQTEWNDDWENVESTGLNSFQFEIPEGMPTPAIGDIVVKFEAAVGSVTSTEKGAVYNQDGNTILTAETSIPGIDDNAGTPFGGIIDGRDDETNVEYEKRILDRWGRPRTPSNPATIEDVVKSIPGNTRVWVKRVTPAVGAVTVYHVRDGDSSIIPSASNLLETKDKIFAQFGAQTEYEDIHVGITGVPINTLISNVAPATATMRTALYAQVRSFFRGQLEEGEDFDIDKYKSHLYQTYDSDRGEKITGYQLDSPTGPASVNAGEICKEGTTNIS